MSIKCPWSISCTGLMYTFGMSIKCPWSISCTGLMYTFGMSIKWSLVNILHWPYVYLWDVNQVVPGQYPALALCIPLGCQSSGPWSISCTGLMYTSGMFRFRVHLQSTSLGTVSYVFTRSTNIMSKGVSSSLGSRIVPWLGQGLSIPSPS